jgi:hypothetical protein
MPEAGCTVNFETGDVEKRVQEDAAVGRGACSRETCGRAPRRRGLATSVDAASDTNRRGARRNVMDRYSAPRAQHRYAVLAPTGQNRQIRTLFGQTRSIGEAKNKKPDSFESGFRINSLTMSYFHTGIRTIIGAKAFHCPVRDGKEWDHLAMVIRLDLSPCCSLWQHGKFIESEIS